MRLKFIIAFLAIFSVLFVTGVFAQPVSLPDNECVITLRESCSTANRALGLTQNEYNAHASLNISNSDYVLCCKYFSSANQGQCSAIGTSPFIALASESNAHAAVSYQGVYQQLACAQNAVNCQAVAGNCPAAAPIGLISMFSMNNSHLAGFSYANYPIKICCQRFDIAVQQGLAVWEAGVCGRAVEAQVGDLIALNLYHNQINFRTVIYTIYDNTTRQAVNTINSEFSGQNTSSATWIVNSSMAGRTFYFNASIQGTNIQVKSNDLSVTPTASNSQPFADILEPADVADNPPGIYFVNTPVSFKQNSFDCDDLINATWYFGDGTSLDMSSSQISSIPTHVYTQEGEYVVRLKVTDTRNAMAWDNVTIRVVATGPEVFAYISLPSEGASVNKNAVNFSGNATYVIDVASTSPPAATCIAGNCPVQTADGIQITGTRLPLSQAFLNFTWRIDTNVIRSKLGNEAGAVEFTQNFNVCGDRIARLQVTHIPSSEQDEDENMFSITGCISPVDQCVGLIQDQCIEQVIGRSYSITCEYLTICRWNSTISSCESIIVQNSSYPSCAVQPTGECRVASQRQLTSCEVEGVLTFNYTYSWTGGGARPATCPESRVQSVQCPEITLLPFFTPVQMFIALSAIALVYAIALAMKKRKEN
jgi:hypothetical protein